MYLFLNSKTNNETIIKILGLNIYKKCVYANNKTIRKFFNVVKTVKFNNIEKFYFLGIKIFTRKNKFKILEHQFNKKLQQYKVKYQKMLSVYNTHKKVFPQFKNIHLNDSIAIVGTGPTLNYYSPFENIKHIALNRAISCDKLTFDYFFCVDGQDDMREYLKTYSNYPCKKFYGQHFNFTPKVKEERGCCHIPDRDAIRDNAYRFFSNAHDNEFYFDLETSPLMDFGSVAFCAIHFALWTQAKRIYLIGCDCTNDGYFNGKQQQFWDLLPSTINGYNKIKNFRDIYYPDTEIISINPVGLKGLFKDVYTQSYIDNNPELLTEIPNIEIIQERRL